ncbi:hypothetical protein RSOLAG1IB_11755 [Rhizoctonia solani AG-1 IB]|uniref:Uncharacterized protein n=1 Tax=Thanatephorus cucumeris (strain AG1-IB / isolate 7/3/14) TaxID=1108050 RepID=M5CA50_THACB|nr:hypothetical protein BN14_10307 [Rhizoctonia solani AG-1 IB]CEL54664.1 hypothetical protein RSOLAG1IB_11755 [Rhizoctonia solani AG-1 IB]
MIFPRATHFIAILSVVLAFGILVCGSPVLTEKRLVSVTTNQLTHDILNELKSDLSEQYSKIDAHRANGTDATEDARKIVQLFNSAATRMNALPKSTTCQPNDKCSEIVDLWDQILIDLLKCAKAQSHRTRAIGDIFGGLSAQVGAAVTAAQGALTGALGGLQALGSQILNASKPHWEQLQEQLVGHGLNVLGFLSGNNK